MNKTIEQRIVEIVAEGAEVDPSLIRPDSTLDDLDTASLTQIEIYFEIEEAFGIDLPDRPEETTLRGLAQLVARLVAEKSADA
jgi:acyl carrier protein